MVNVTTPPGGVLSTAQVADEVTAAFFRILSSPIRLGVVRLLLERERCVSELVDELGIAQPRLSNHLACLRTCGFVVVRREGTFLYYALADERLAEFLRLSETLVSSRAGVLTVCPVLSREERIGKD